MRNLKKFLIIMGFIVLIPIIGILVSSLVSNGYEKKYEHTMIQVFKEKRGVDVSHNKAFLNKIKLAKICKYKNLSPAFAGVCGEYNSINKLFYASVATLIFTFLMFLLIYILGLIARNNRNLLFCLFRPGLLISQISTAILVIANAGILVFSIYFAESFYFGSVHVFLIGSLGFVALITAVGVIDKSFRLTKNIEAKVFGKILDKKNYPTIWNFIDVLSKKIGTKSPDAIVAGMDPTFFVTEAKVVCLDGNIRGRTLYLSLPFCRALSKDEFSAIIGHEMGHFIGEDTKWSKKFYPIYNGSIATLYELDYSGSDNGLAQLACFPAMIFMNIFIFAFAKSEKAISRQRELSADNLGADITSKEKMAAALIKVHAYQYVWQFTQREIVEALSNGQQIINVSKFFSEVCGSVSGDDMKDDVTKSYTSHPIDSHPPLSTRLESMGIKANDFYSEGIANTDSDKAIELIDNVDVIEKELSELEHHRLIRSGVVSVPNGEKQVEKRVVEQSQEV
ncbi:MAG: M48 family metallopeptidase [Gammaproteobacteria bacterium]|jgi:Zn-dependent protease with chaperone function